MNHEHEFVRAFIVESKRARYLAKLASPTKRRSFLSRLHHNLDLAPKVAQQVPPGDQTASLIEEKLRRLGAPAQCHAIATGSDMDGRDLPLHEALSSVVGMGNGVILSCIPGVLAYYESEEKNGRYILFRATPKRRPVHGVA